MNAPSPSTAIGLVAAIFTLIVAPRYYDYDKVLFYTAGLALAWRYFDDRRLPTLLVAAMVTVAAGLFRYDNGVFLFAATLTTIVICHWRTVHELLRCGAAYTAGVALGLAPALITWQETVGGSEVLRQVRAYAQLEGEPTGIFKPPIPRVDAGRSILSSLVSPENHAVLLYYAIVALLPVAAAALLWRWYRTESERSMPHEAPKIAATVVLGVLAAVAPQLYFFAERGFAGGMPVFFGGHWSSVQDQERTIEQLRREFVSLAIVDPGFSSTYDRVGAFLASTFVQAGSAALATRGLLPPATRCSCGAVSARCRSTVAGIFRVFPGGRLQNRAVHEPSGCAGSSRCSILRCSGTNRRTTFLKGTK